MTLHCGIVGLPNVGKSTLFNALTEAGIAAENYPFCTIDPNVGTVAVPDERLAALAALVHPQRILPAAIEFVDIAGLVAGAAKGEGLGNQFLSHIRETDAIIHVVRCFQDDDVVHVAGTVNPLQDMAVIDAELILADLATVEKTLARHSKAGKAGDKQARLLCEVLERLVAHLENSLPARSLSMTPAESELLAPLHLLTLKPVLYVANVAEQGFIDNPLLAQVERKAAAEGAQVVAICAAIEAELATLTPAEKQEFLHSLGMQEAGLDRLIRAAYALLNLQTYFTAGEKEVRAWTIHRGDTAPQAAGVIHSDFAKGFIRAEVIAYADFIQCSGEQGAKEAGKWRLEGKTYIVNDGDVIHFRFNV